jgi:hypothetical protein
LNIILYVNILTQSLPLNSARFHVKIPKHHLAHKCNLYLTDITSFFAFLVKLAKNTSDRHICCMIILNRHIYISLSDESKNKIAGGVKNGYGAC